MTDLEYLVNNYQPSETTKKMLIKHPPLLLAGVSGAGKNYLINELLKTGDYHDFVTHTTRAPRENDGVLEQNGVDYYFIDQAKAIDMLKRQEFIEAKLVHEFIYGSSVAEYQKALTSLKTPLADVDVQGVMEYKSMAPKTKALFILPPSYEVWMERLKGRFANEAEFMLTWPKRRVSAIAELEFALSSHMFEWVINDAEASVVLSRITVLLASDGDDFMTAEQKQIAKDLLAKLKAEEGRLL